uniref:Non-specific lipid-transfer protein n=1 Tax=Kalanchoe fedtschenkoi TaxID=63787 RepID=A0A7N0TR05_KALFE
MMKFSASVFPVAAVALLLLLTAPTAEGAISCTEVIGDLRPCISYLKSGSGNPPTACCAGASALANAATTSTDKRAACDCIKTAARALNPNPELAKDLPKKCGIDLPFTISASLDCTKLG